VDGHDRHHDLGVGQDLGGSVGLERHRPQDGGQGVAAMPQPSGGVELEAASVLLSVGFSFQSSTFRNNQRLLVRLGPPTTS
jgi:hypothetical protein